MGSDVAAAGVPTRPATAAVAESGHMVHQAPGARALPGRDGRRRSLAYFAHLTDTQIADEASPARHEWLYGLKPMFEGFWRPQEAFILHVIDQVVRAVNRRRISPLPSAGGPGPLGFALVTGDLADTAQLNEVRWGVRVLDGGQVDPFSGRRISRRNPCRAPQAVRRRLNRAVARRRYAGVAVSRTSLAQWPGSLNRAQRPFTAEGLAVPWFSARGNHDASPQGHYGPAIARPGSVPTGCRKVMAPRAPATAIADPWGSLRRTLPRATFVPPDPRRRFLRSAAEFRRLHGKADHAHGFGFTSSFERQRSRGTALYYSFSPHPALRFIALDTTADAGGDGGNLDHPQYLWLARQLRRAERGDELVVVYAHHPLEMMDNRAHDELAGRFDRDPRNSWPIHLGRTGPANLRKLLMRSPNVILYLAGHKHYDRVWPNFRRAGRGFWQVITSGLAGPPQEARMIELMDNGDGSLSIFTTMLPHAAPADVPRRGAALGPAALASISRELAWQRRPSGRRARTGGPMQNTELVLSDPREAVED
ncbi:MAG TPA: metallophosphoesterase [Thermoleophilaceae bacterium]|nr:metallophosphoesterase [Thermoleophilaceae bacterium]